MGEEQTAQNNSVINVFNECLDAFAASEQLSEQEQNGLIRAIGELAVSSMAEGYLYGATEDSDLYQIADSLRQKIFLDDIPESNRQILKGMFYIINTAAHSVLPRITASQNDDLTVLKSMEGKTSPTENVDPKLLFNYKTRE